MMNKDNITYIDTSGNEVTTERKYTEYPYDLSDVLLLEKDNVMLNVRNPFSGERYLL